jgi:GTP-binding protein HflX
MQATQPGALRAILIGVDLVGNHSLLGADESLAELRQLAQTAGIEVVGEAKQRLRNPHPATYVGKGKVDEIREAASDQRADVVIFDDELSPSQQRNLEEALKLAVIDRSQVILDVFSQRARTREGQLQVQLASYEYQFPRLAGAWTHLSRQFGRGATRGGPGETQLEVDRRQVRQKIGELKKQIEGLRAQRQLHRDHRREQGMKVVALVGYTNAGKSTLFNALVHAGVSVKDRPFETLDPTVRRLRFASGQTVLLSDTVGFIQKLPLTLVAAFRATLEELESADVLIHVLDVTHIQGFEQGVAVQQTLDSLAIGTKPVVTALNKIDRLVGVIRASDVEVGELAAMLDELVEHYPNAVPISAAKGWNLGRLEQAIEQTLVNASL